MNLLIALVYVVTMMLSVLKSSGLRMNRFGRTSVCPNKVATSAIHTYLFAPTKDVVLENLQRVQMSGYQPKLRARTLRRFASTQESMNRVHVPNNLDYVNVDHVEHVDGIAVDNFMKEERIPVKIVENEAEANKVLEILRAHPNHIWACDTEVADIDVKKVGPVGNGKVICVSIYGGDDVDFGNGCSTLWINNDGAALGILQKFKAWFENDRYKKVWHNYGFDRHVMFNEGIDCRGFGGDTMHMARLWDSSRDKATGGGDGYSLEALSCDTHLFPPDSPGKKFFKTSMKELFGVAKVKKDGGESKVKELPDLREVQNNAATRDRWIEYSARDAVATWWVRQKITNELKKMPWQVAGASLPHVQGERPNMYHFYMNYLKDFGELLTDMERNGIKLDTTGHLKEAEVKAREERTKMENMFIEWASKYCSDTQYINIASPAQMQQLLFGEYEEFQLKSRERVFKLDKSAEELEQERQEVLLTNPYANHGAAELRAVLKDRGLKLTGKKDDQVSKLLEYDAKYAEMLSTLSAEEVEERCTQRGLECTLTKEEMVKLYLMSEAQATAKEAAKQKREAKKLATAASVESEDGSPAVPVLPVLTPILDSTIEVVAVDASPSNATMPKKKREITITTIGLKPTDFTPTGIPQVSAAVLKKLSGKNVFGDEKDAVWGTAYEFFGGGEEGRRACRAIGALALVGQIDATITNFLVPLQALVDKHNRIHCSLNLNTETGRLSSRRPNLQNQPALEKDQYKIRDAFVAEEGKTLIVADYGQLELRILAHISNCDSMIQAFKQGGCFHSRTAVGMYDYVRKAVDNGEVMLEWDYSKGQPTVPLVKDTYGSERRKAKTLNFSIAYGKTVHGLAQDWGITKEAAQETLDCWYRDRPEVKKWQEQTMYAAKRNGWVNTIMGRYRKLQEAKATTGPAMGHALRAAINTPIQGSAADIVMMAMIKLWKSEVLKGLGWKLLLQIHDEVILEGPKESLDEAMAEVRQCMERPYDEVLKELRVTLDVDAKSADSWYKAK